MPMTMNMSRHPSIEALDETCWKAQEIRPPKTCPRPIPRYQRAKREDCSRLVYHWLLISMSEGGMPDSKIPLNTLAAIKELKPFVAATHAVAMPQANRMKLRYLAAGILWSKKTGHNLSVQTITTYIILAYHWEPKNTKPRRRKWIQHPRSCYLRGVMISRGPLHFHTFVRVSCFFMSR